MVDPAGSGLRAVAGCTCHPATGRNEKATKPRRGRTLAPNGSRRRLPQHADEYGPKDSILLAVDQELSEGATLRDAAGSRPLTLGHAQLIWLRTTGDAFLCGRNSQACPGRYDGELPGRVAMSHAPWVAERLLAVVAATGLALVGSSCGGNDAKRPPIAPGPHSAVLKARLI